MRLLAVLVAGFVSASAPPAQAAPDEAGRLRAIAGTVTITRDDWGIAHIRAHTDAEAVFGMIYAQAEDDFNRIELNYLVALGRLAEADGERALMQDLRARLYGDPADLQARYRQSPAWLRALMDGWADGLNFYLATHPAVRPRVLRHFEPWMALAFSEGSIGGDIERIPLAGLAEFYNQPRHAMLEDPFAGLRGQPTGSNGIAIAPKNTRDHHALLLINPHTSFYFRAEVQMTSDEGLNAYGAATWGQFFLYQGFNDRLGWMHTSTTADAVDQFLETIVAKDGKIFTRYGGALRPVTSSAVTLAYRLPDGRQAQRSFTVLRSVHGPIVGKAADGRWIAEAMMFRPTEALEQSYGLTKARDYQAYMKVMALQANTSNNTVYADADGHIALLLPQFLPKRDDTVDYTKPVDGADPRTDWNGLLPLDSLPHVLDPTIGWIENTNNWPYSASGKDSPVRGAYPRYLDTEGENMRGLHAIDLLTGKSDFTLESLVTAAFDPHLTGFERLIPPLLDAYDQVPPGDKLKADLADQIAVLRAWDRKWATGSVATSLAVYWGEALWRVAGVAARDVSLDAYSSVLARTSPAQRLAALAEASATLARDFGTWRVAWGSINRFQRLNDAIVPHFSAAAPSLPVGFTSSKWGSLASITGPHVAGVKKRYGNSGNSFVAAVEFGPHLRAVAVTAGGESGDPASRHFDDQAQRYTTGALRNVYFTPTDLAGHTERTYHPGA
jgi:acyl-homoserine-lactone acylase